MSRAKETATSKRVSIPERDISVAILYPGTRVDKMQVPLEATEMDVEVEPADAYDFDIVLLDNADRDMIWPVLRRPISHAKIIYRMRGDLYRELELWDMHPLKKWLATNVVVANVDGAICANEILAEKIRRVSGVRSAGVAGLAKRVDDYPRVQHRGTSLRIITLTNAEYLRKIRPLIEYAPVVEDYLSVIGGRWHIYGEGRHAGLLADGLREFDHVDFRGHTERPKAALADSNLMLHLSNLDALPNSMLEGMASNLPVITNDFEAFEVYNGPIHRIGNETQLLDALRKAQAPPWREDRGCRGREFVRQYHTPEAVGQQYVDFFREVLGGGRP